MNGYSIIETLPTASASGVSRICTFCHFEAHYDAYHVLSHSDIWLHGRQMEHKDIHLYRNWQRKHFIREAPHLYAYMHTNKTVMLILWNTVYLFTICVTFQIKRSYILVSLAVKLMLSWVKHLIAIWYVWRHRYHGHLSGQAYKRLLSLFCRWHRCDLVCVLHMTWNDIYQPLSL